MEWTCLSFISLAKTIWQGTVKGGRRQGRQKKGWEENIREWTDLEFTKSKRAVENNNKKWRKLDVKSFVVHQRPSKLGDRCGEVRDRTVQNQLSSDNFQDFWKTGDNIGARNSVQSELTRQAFKLQHFLRKGRTSFLAK